MNDNEMMGILGNYFSEDEIERYRSMRTKNKRDYLFEESKRIVVECAPQYLVASAIIYSQISGDNGVRVASLFVKNSGDMSCDYKIEVELDRSRIFTFKRKIDPKSSLYEELSCDDGNVVRYSGSSAYAKLKITDRLGRELCSTSREVRIVKGLTRPDVSVGFINRSDDMVTLKLESKEKTGVTLMAKCISGDTVFAAVPIILLPGEARNRDVPVVLPKDSDNCKLAIDCDGYLISEFNLQDKSNQFTGDGKTTSFHIYADCECQKVVDTSALMDGHIPLCSVGIRNEEYGSQTVSVLVTIDDRNVFTDNI